MTGEQEWLLVGVLFLVGAFVWIAAPRYRGNTIVRAALAIPVAAFGTMLVISLVFAVLMRQMP